MSNQPKKPLALDEQQPAYDDPTACPSSIATTRRFKDILYIAGEGPEQADIMFAVQTVEEDDAAESIPTSRGMTLKQRPKIGRSAGLQLLMDAAGRAGIDEDKVFLTALCRWLLPRNKRSKPDRDAIQWGIPALMSDIERVQPKIIVCGGKAVFDALCDKRINFNDAHGGWFWSTKANAYLYLMHAPYMLVAKPEWYEMFRLDLMEVKRKLQLITEGFTVGDAPVREHVAQNEQELRGIMQRIKSDALLNGDIQQHIVSVDCEWHGQSFVDGQLRMAQFAWTDSDALVVEFRNEKNEFAFELDDIALSMLSAGADSPAELEAAKYRYIGSILGEYFDRPHVKYVGHHYSADAPWLIKVLGMQGYDKCVLDTEFAQQCVDETSELKLERGIAMRYTTLGRYDMDLIAWKRENKALCEDGYGYIPRDIIIPYAARDVIAVRRAVEPIKRQMRFQKLEDYWNNILCPFVTDGFTHCHIIGLPMDVAGLDELRSLFQWAKVQLEREFRKKVEIDAWGRLLSLLVDSSSDMPAAIRLFQQIQKDEHSDELWERAADIIPDKARVAALRQHLAAAPEFNIRSSDQLRRWLFDVVGLHPIKSTNKKAQGMPSMSWDKVLELPKDRQALYAPAVDKQTISILAIEYQLLNEMLDFNAVGNVCKAFLKEPEVYFDEEEGEEVVEEAGLHAWISSDHRIHGQLSLTETGRTRSWNPNTLNWPSYVNKRIASSIKRVLDEAVASNTLPPELQRWVMPGVDVPSIRSVVTAPPGWVIVESDYKTAEMVGLAVISKDYDLMRILFDPDPEWACLKDGNRFGVPYVRVKYSAPEDNGIPADMQDAKYVMHAWKEGEKAGDPHICLGKVEPEDLAYNPDGSVKHRGYDIHWSIAERVYEKPRESMTEKVHRNAGKVLNFCVDGDALVLTRDRGPVAIRNIRIDDLVWDGVAWVSHEGVIYSGRKQVIEYQGLRATRLHDVWTVECGKVKLEEACAKSLTLVRTADAGQSTPITWFESVSGVSGTPRVGVLLPENGVPALRYAEVEGAAQHGDRKVFEVSMSQPTTGVCEVSRQSPRGSQFSGPTLCCDEAEMREGHARVVAPIPGERYQGGVPEQGGVHRMGVTELHRLGHPHRGLRPDGQQRELLAGEPPVGGSHDEPAEQGIGYAPELSGGQAVPKGQPGSAVYVEDGAGAYENGVFECRDYDAACAQYCCGEAETYDIVNAGPRHRFTCSGVLVSNSSAYGASPASLERKIESDTGVKPEPGTGQKGLDAIAMRQPRATEFLEEMARVPAEKGYYRAASGRIRHCVLHSRESGVGWRVRQSQESALGREMRNCPMQESVASTTARAFMWLRAAYARYGLKAEVLVTLYDSVLTLAPLEERFVVKRLHDIYMSEVNSWQYDELTLRYGVDTEFNYKWSTKPTKAQKAELYDPTWHPTPDRLKALENAPSFVS